MVKRKREDGDEDDEHTDGHGHEYGLPLDANGLVPNGFTLSFADFDGVGMTDDEDDSDSQDEDVQEGDDDEVEDHDIGPQGLPHLTRNDSHDSRRGGTGSQVLPVANYLPDDFSGVPEDGHEYLFLVRREAASHPGVIFAKQFTMPLAIDGPQGSASVTSSDGLHTTTKPAHRPSDEWRSNRLSHIQLMRQSLSGRSTSQALEMTIPEHYLPIPAAADESSWKSYINGRRRKLARPKPESAESPLGSPDANIANLSIPTQVSALIQPRPPTPTVLRALEQHAVISLLDHFNTWLSERLDPPPAKLAPTAFVPPSVRRKAATSSATPKASINEVVDLPDLLSPLESQWLLSLLAVLDPLLASQDLSILRTLARTCQRVADMTFERQKRAVRKFSSQQGDMQDPSLSSNAVIESCWTIVAAVWEIWGQRDLWM